MLLTLVTLALLGDVAPGPRIKRPAPPPSQCSADADCVLSTFQGCCGGCCGVAPHAIPRGFNEQARCAVVDCAMPDCSAVRCAKPPDPNDFAPACRSGRCVAVPKNEAPAQCRVNADCTVVTAVPPAGALCHSSPCGCCPVTQAVPIDAAIPLQQRQGPPKKADPKKPNFGLSTGNGLPPPQAPSCAACPPPAGGTAVCQAGRCVLQQLPPPRPLPRPG